MSSCEGLIERWCRLFRLALPGRRRIALLLEVRYTHHTKHTYREVPIRVEA